MVALLPIWTSLLPVAIKAGLELFFIVAGPFSGERADVPGVAFSLVSCLVIVIQQNSYEAM